MASKASKAPSVPLRSSRLAPLVQPIEAFLSAESAGGIILVASAVIALVWANSPWADFYEHVWHAPLAVRVGDFELAMSLSHWVNDGLMVLFFLLVGLEIKRELLIGELASFRKASLPIGAAIGGMVAPMLIYLALNRGGAAPAHAGWGIPMATDIAFAIGVLALVGRGVPMSVKVFLLAIAIVDDLGAVVVIAVFYTSKISMHWLMLAGAFLAALVLLNALRVHRLLPYMLIGIGFWIATLFSGIHSTIAGVLLAFAIPATRQIEEQPYVDYVRQMLAKFERDATAVPDKITEEQSNVLSAMQLASQAVQTPQARVEHALLKPVAFLIVPLFALANAGVDVRSAGSATLEHPVTWGVLLGLLLGKPIGILLASWLTIKSGIAAMPEGATWRHVLAVSVLCGIGFTMSLFVANLAFVENPELLSAAKIGILAASLLAGLAGGWFFARASASSAAEESYEHH